jgi:hypothetical protein
MASMIRATGMLVMMADASAGEAAGRARLGAEVEGGFEILEE